mmetsp:Transcript_75554/g.161898  ORF Transcript_75554/g.161898 Transcript_75554/m.161898 type:complete len:301 (+) Transcript_75554:1214-2116(+)
MLPLVISGLVYDHTCGEATKGQPRTETCAAIHRVVLAMCKRLSSASVIFELPALHVPAEMLQCCSLPTSPHERLPLIQWRSRRSCGEGDRDGIRAMLRVVQIRRRAQSRDRQHFSDRALLRYAIELAFEHRHLLGIRRIEAKIINVVHSQGAPKCLQSGPVGNQGRSDFGLDLELLVAELPVGVDRGNRKALTEFNKKCSRAIHSSHKQSLTSLLQAPGQVLDGLSPEGRPTRTTTRDPAHTAAPCEQRQLHEVHMEHNSALLPVRLHERLVVQQTKIRPLVPHDVHRGLRFCGRILRFC